MDADSTEKHLKVAVAKLYQEYDKATDEYDKLFSVIDNLREDYYNSKTSYMWKRYAEWRRIIKNAVRKWRNVERRSTFGLYGKQKHTPSPALKSAHDQNGKSTPNSNGRGEMTNNLNMRIKAQTNEVTRNLYDECQRLEKEIFDYKSRNRQIKDAMAKLASEYDASKNHTLHIYGRYKELRMMIKDALMTDV